jgi:hypothetical protein
MHYFVISFFTKIIFSQGWAADFIPKLVNEASKIKAYDEVVHPGGREAMATCKELARKEGIFSGTSFLCWCCTDYAARFLDLTINIQQVQVEEGFSHQR